MNNKKIYPKQNSPYKIPYSAKKQIVQISTKNSKSPYKKRAASKNNILNQISRELSIISNIKPKNHIDTKMINSQKNPVKLANNKSEFIQKNIKLVKNNQDFSNYIKNTYKTKEKTDMLSTLPLPENINFDNEESPHEIEVRVLCDRIHKLETELENKNEELDKINSKIEKLHKMNEIISNDINKN